MFIIGQFFCAIARLLDMVFGIYYFLLVVRVILSWVNPNPYNPIVQFLFRVTEPILLPIRRVIPPIGGTIDISPIIAFIILYFVKDFVVGSLLEIGYRLK